MLHAVFQPLNVDLKINVARKVHVKKSCNEEVVVCRVGVCSRVVHRRERRRAAARLVLVVRLRAEAQDLAVDAHLRVARYLLR